MLQLKELEEHITVIDEVISGYSSVSQEMVKKVNESLKVLSKKYPKIKDLLNEEATLKKQIAPTKAKEEAMLKEAMLRRATKEAMLRRVKMHAARRAAQMNAARSAAQMKRAKEEAKLKQEIELLKQKAIEEEKEQKRIEEELIMKDINTELEKHDSDILIALKAHAEAQLALL